MALAKKLAAWSPKLLQGEQMTPEVGYVQIGELHFDWQRWEGGRSVGYQRQLDEGRVGRYSAEYDPRLARPVVVNRRADGSMYVIDGQHTIAIERGLGRSVVLATVWDGLTPQQEADLYNRLNSQRVTPNQWNRFGARATAGDPKALAIIALAAECGFKTGTPDRSINAIAAVNALERLYDVSPALLRQTLTKIRELWPTDVVTRDGVFISGLAWFIYTWDEAFYPTSVGTEGDVIDWRRFDDVFSKVTGRDVVRDVAVMRIESGMSVNAAAYAVAFRDKYNGKSNFRRRLLGRPISPASGRRGAVERRR